MIADADRQVKERLGSIEEETKIQERRLADAKEATAKYLEPPAPVPGPAEEAGRHRSGRLRPSGSPGRSR